MTRKSKYSPLTSMESLDHEAPWGDTFNTGKSKGGGWSNYKRCHDDHKELQIGGGTLLGASCLHPRPDFDVYVGFDSGMKLPDPPAPWHPAPKAKPKAVHAKFLITDGSVPKDKAEFDLMLAYLVAQLAEGKRVHIGCIGGHGRTGLVIAALVAVVNGEKDAIGWVREHHCKKAVETKGQVDWLVEHYGVATAKASKSWDSSSFSGTYGDHGKYPAKSHGGGMGLSGKGPGGKAVFKSSESARSDIKNGTTLKPLAGPSTLFRVA